MRKVYRWLNISLISSMQFSGDATALHESLMPLIPTDEQQKQNEGFSKVNNIQGTMHSGCGSMV